MCDHITKRSFFVVVALFLMISREALSRDSPGVSQKLGDPLSEHTLEPLLNFLQIFAPKLLYSTGSSVMTYRDGMGAQREAVEGRDTCIYACIQLIPFDVEQKLTQRCKSIILQFKKTN